METHQPYEQLLNRPHDFKVSYTFFDENEGGRKELPHQGIRSNFWYEADHEVAGVFIIWPEFENLDGVLIGSGVVPKKGTARMWVINDAFRNYHRNRITIGAKGYFIEGKKRTAQCIVIAINNLSHIANS